MYMETDLKSYKFFVSDREQWI